MVNNKSTIFGENVRFLRRSKNMSQEALANKLGYKSYTTVQKWEYEGILPSVETVNNISELFDVPLQDLLYQKLELLDSYAHLALPPSGIEDLQSMNNTAVPGSIVSERIQNAGKKARREMLNREIEGDTLPPSAWLKQPTLEPKAAMSAKRVSELQPIPAYALTDDEVRLVTYYRKLTGTDKEWLLRTAERL